MFTFRQNIYTVLILAIEPVFRTGNPDAGLRQKCFAIFVQRLRFQIDIAGYFEINFAQEIAAFVGFTAAQLAEIFGCILIFIRIKTTDDLLTM